MPKYILVKCKTARSGDNCTRGYTDFNELRAEVTAILDNRGWDNKETVDLRSVDSCLRYVLGGNFRDITYKYSTNYGALLDYKTGKKALVY